MINLLLNKLTITIPLTKIYNWCSSKIKDFITSNVKKILKEQKLKLESKSWIRFSSRQWIKWNKKLITQSSSSLRLCSIWKTYQLTPIPYFWSNLLRSAPYSRSQTRTKFYHLNQLGCNPNHAFIWSFVYLTDNNSIFTFLFHLLFFL